VHILDQRATSSSAKAGPGLSRPFVAALMLANFGTNIALIAPIQNILPRMIESASDSGDKALGLGVVTGLGAFAALIFNPLAGYFSDRWVGADNRVATILVGLAAGGTAHIVLGFQHSMVGIALWWTICQATINIAYAPMSAIVVDHADRRHWGLVWGLISLAQAVGLILGLAAVVLLFPSTTAGMVAISISYMLCLVPLVIVLPRLPRPNYARADGSRGASTLRALLAPDQGFGQVFVGRFLIMLAETVALLYLFYYLQDVIHYRDPSDGQLILILVATLAAVIATVIVGRLADTSGNYRRYVVAASLLMALAGFLLAGIDKWALVIGCAFVLGAGYGAFQSVSQALSNVVLPSPANAGRDLGIINISSAVPQVIGAPIAGVVVANLGGYRGLFIFAGLIAVAAGAVFSRVPSSPNREPSAGDRVPSGALSPGEGAPSTEA
jgi:MFS family permease